MCSSDLDYLSSSTGKLPPTPRPRKILHLENTAVEVIACDYILRQGQGLHRKGGFILRSSSVRLRHWVHSPRWGRNPLTPTALSAGPSWQKDTAAGAAGSLVTHSAWSQASTDHSMPLPCSQGCWAMPPISVTLQDRRQPWI